MFKILFGLVAALSFSLALAQAVPATDPVPRVAFPLTQVGNISTLGPRTADASNAAKFSFGVASNGSIFANTTDRLPTPGGQSIPIGVSGTIAKPNVVAALGRFARKTLPVLSVGVALYDLGEELGFGLDNSGGTLLVSKPDTTLCTVAPCYEYRHTVAANQPWGRSSAAACTAGFAAVQGSSTTTVYTFLSFVAPTQCTGQRVINGGAPTHSAISLERRSASVQAPASMPSTVQEFEDAISAKLDWPPSSALARATVDAIKSGESPLVEPQTVTGPASSPGPSSSVHNVTNNTTTLSTVTNNHTYAGPQISTTKVTNTSVINNATQEVISEEETVEQPVIPQVPEPQKLEFPCGAAGLPACNVKVDEAGVPAASTATGNFNQGTTDLEAVRLDAVAAIDDAAEDDDLPPWSWTFQLPTGCSPFAMEAFSLELDICQFQPIIHDIMSFLWLSAGVFGLLALFRSSVGT